jgi:hypothetical protein
MIDEGLIVAVVFDEWDGVTRGKGNDLLELLTE